MKAARGRPAIGVKSRLDNRQSSQVVEVARAEMASRNFLRVSARRELVRALVLALTAYIASIYRPRQNMLEIDPSNLCRMSVS